MKSDESYKEQFIQDYLFASGVADGALKAATKEMTKIIESGKRQY